MHEKAEGEKETLACEVCMNDISSDEAETFEVDDYVHHFCGLDCYTKWEHKKKHEKTDE